MLQKIMTVALAVFIAVPAYSQDPGKKSITVTVPPTPGVNPKGLGDKNSITVGPKGPGIGPTGTTSIFVQPTPKPLPTGKIGEVKLPAGTQTITVPNGGGNPPPPPGPVGKDVNQAGIFVPPVGPLPKGMEK